MLLVVSAAGADGAGALTVAGALLLIAVAVSFNGEACLLVGVLAVSLDIDDDWIEFVEVTISLPLFEMTESRGFGLVSLAVLFTVLVELVFEATLMF